MNRRWLLGTLPATAIAKPVGAALGSETKPHGVGFVQNVPMRIASNDPTDPGYENFVRLKAMGKKILVYLDGVKIRRVGMADEIRGLVEVAEEDETGHLFMRDGGVATKILKGVVRIVLEDERK